MLPFLLFFIKTHRVNIKIKKIIAVDNSIIKKSLIKHMLHKGFG